MPEIRVNDIRRADLSRPTEAQLNALFGEQTEDGKRTRRVDPKKVTMWSVPTSDDGTRYAYTFPFAPQQVQYNNLSPEISEISRPGRLPIIAFNKHRARQVAIKFLIAQPQDGLFGSVDDSIAELFAMIETARPVYFTNMDAQISNSLAETGTSNALRIFWSITDLNFSSIRRNADNQVVAAEANMTLVENVNIKVKIADLPRIVYTETPINNKPKPGPKETDYLTISQGRHRIVNESTSGGVSGGPP